MYCLDIPKINATVRTIHTKQDAEDFFNKAQDAEFTAYDYETGGKEEGDALNWNRGYLMGASFSYKRDEAVYVPIKHLTDNADVGAINTMLEFMGTSNLVAHNFSFEYSWTKAKYKITPKTYTDTMLLIGIWDATLKCKGLKDFTKHYYNFEMQDFKDVTKKTKDFARVSVKDGFYYGCSDALWTYRIAEDLLAEIKKDKGLMAILRIENECLPIMCEMQYNGIRIDTKLLIEYDKIIKNNLAKILNEIKEIIKGALPKYVDRDIFGNEILLININSSKDLTKVFTDLGFKYVDETGLAKDVLKTINHPLAKKISEYRAEDKIRSTYIDPYKKMTSHTNIIYAGFKQIGAQTGRMSGYEPNLMQVVKIRD